MFVVKSTPRSYKCYNFCLNSTNFNQYPLFTNCNHLNQAVTEEKLQGRKKDVSKDFRFQFNTQAKRGGRGRYEDNRGGNRGGDRRGGGRFNNNQGRRNEGNKGYQKKVRV